MVVLYYLLDTTRVNCATVRHLQNLDKELPERRDKHPPINQLEFGWELVRSLVTPLMESRRQNSR